MISEYYSSPKVMGIVNINDDSFSGDGSLSIEGSLNKSYSMISYGADIIDIGAESARTNRKEISVNEEISRLIPFIERFDKKNNSVLLSVNTWRNEVIERVLKTGKVDIINDISGLTDLENARVCSRYNSKLLIMHTVGKPKIPHLHQKYLDVMDDIHLFFEDRINKAVESGLKLEDLILDPGLDFAKQIQDNLKIMNNLNELLKYNIPILLPISRKTFIGEVLNIENVPSRDSGTISCLVRGMMLGASIFRVHNVKAISDSIRVISNLI